MVVSTSALLMACVAVASADASQRAREHFTRGETLYQQGQFVAAIAEFEAANTENPHGSSLFNVGRCYEGLGEVPRALRYYLEAQRASAGLDTAAHISGAIQEAERQLQTRGVQALVVRTTPAGAHVVVDGKDLGAAPIAAELAPGLHAVSVSDGRGATVTRDVTLAAETALEVELPLGPPVGLAITWPPALATGGAFALAGIGLGIGAQTQRNALFSAPHSRSEVNTLTARTTGLATAANVAYAAAGVAIIAAVVLYVVEHSTAGRASTPGASR